MRWLSHIFNRTACIYQTATQWDLPPDRITIWLIDDVMLIYVCFHEDMILGFCYTNLTSETVGLEIASTITLTLQANRLTKCASHIVNQMCLSCILLCFKSVNSFLLGIITNTTNDIDSICRKYCLPSCKEMSFSYKVKYIISYFQISIKP